MAPKLTKTSQEILEKKFDGAPRGYNPLQVDEFLDSIIKDYLIIESNVLANKEDIDKLKEQVAKLKEDKQKLEIELGKYKERFANLKPSDNVTSDNLELLKKINRYETFLYRMGYDPNTIK